MRTHPRVPNVGKRDGPVGRVAIQRDVDAAGPPEQRQPCGLPAAGPVEPAGASVPQPGHERGQPVRNPLAEDHGALPGIPALYR